MFSGFFGCDLRGFSVILGVFAFPVALLGLFGFWVCLTTDVWWFRVFWFGGLPCVIPCCVGLLGCVVFGLVFMVIDVLRVCCEGLCWSALYVGALFVGYLV